MSKSKDEEAPQVYYIPGNYDESGGVLGGRIKTRNAIELVVFCGPIAWLEYHFLKFSVQTNIIIALITLIPLGALCIFGVSGETLSQILLSFLRYQRNKRLLHYDMFAQTDDAAGKKFNIDKFLDVAASSGIKAAIEKMNDERNAANEEKGKKSPSKKKPKSKALRRRGESSEDAEDVKEIQNELRRQERAIKGQTRGWMAAAKRDKGHSSLNNPSAKKKKKKKR